MLFSSFRPFSLRIRDRLHAFDRPVVMGILNLTPDSFHAGSRTGLSDVVRRAAEMQEAGAGILDMGGQSTRPGSLRIPAAEERERVVPAIREVLKALPDMLISVDTYSSEVAEAALDAGASMVNDVSAGLLDPAIWEVCRRFHVPYVLMHMPGTPEDLHHLPAYDDLVGDVFRFFCTRLEMLKEKGVHDVMLDPGFGFGKRLEENYALLGSLWEFRRLERPLLVGVSRKKMIRSVIGSDESGAMSGSVAAAVIALMQGASVIRTHDVEETVQAVRVVMATFSGKAGT